MIPTPQPPFPEVEHVPGDPRVHACSTGYAPHPLLDIIEPKPATIFEEPWVPVSGHVPNEVLAGDLFDACAPELPDGRHTLHIDRVTGDGGRIRLHVSNEQGAAIVPIGALPDRRTLNRNLRILLGRTDLDSLDEIRDALEGETILVRLGTYRYRQSEYRGLNRA